MGDQGRSPFCGAHVGVYLPLQRVVDPEVVCGGAREVSILWCACRRCRLGRASILTPGTRSHSTPLKRISVEKEFIDFNTYCDISTSRTHSILIVIVVFLHISAIFGVMIISPSSWMI